MRLSYAIISIFLLAGSPAVAKHRPSTVIPADSLRPPSIDHTAIDYHQPPQTVPKAADHAIRDIPSQTIIADIQRQPHAMHDQTLCLALALYHEQRELSQGTDRLAVAQVIYNRAKQTDSSVCATIWALHGSQFQWVKYIGDLTPREIAVWQHIQDDAVAFVRHRPADITSGATLFYNALLVRPAWANNGQVTIRLSHTFIRVESHNK
jgi:spore germination cell wall hydrolase CwlJ-like protein